MGLLDRFRPPDVDGMAAQRDVAGLSKAAGHAKAEVRLKAVVALGGLGDATALPTLASSLRDETPEVRRAAVSALAALGDHRALIPLAILVNAEIKLAASWAKEFFGEATVVGAGMRAFDEFVAGVHRQRGVRQAAFEALSQLEEQLPRSETNRIAANLDHISDAGLLQVDRACTPADISRLDARRTPALRVTFCGEEYEMEGSLVYDESQRTWFGIPKWESWRRL